MCLAGQTVYPTSGLLHVRGVYIQQNDWFHMLFQSQLSHLSLKEKKLNTREKQLEELSLLAASAQDTISAYIEEQASKTAYVGRAGGYTHWNAPTTMITSWHADHHWLFPLSSIRQIRRL